MAKLGVFVSVFFSPGSVFMGTMLPLVLVGVVTTFYVLTWIVYAQTAARPLKFSSFPWDPRRILKLNQILFLSTIPTNISLIPVAFSLIKYRLWTMRGSQGLIVDVHYNSKRPFITLDVHAPELTTQQTTIATGKQAGRPVIIFIYGGAWSSGSKKVYTLLGAQLRAMGYVVVIPDYTTFPRGLSKEMEEDVQMAIHWTQEHCETYGGDPNQIYLMGHSAGAHLCSLTIIKDCVRQWMNTTRQERQESIRQSPVLAGLLQECAFQEGMSLETDKDLGRALLRLRGLILCSGVYNISAHLEHEKIRGVEEVSAMSRVMGNSLLSFGMNSPSMILQEIARTSSSLPSSILSETSSTAFDAVKINATQEGSMQTDDHLSHFRSLLPEKILVVHGEDDRTVPASSSMHLHSALQSFIPSDDVRLHVISNMMHQAPIVAIMPSFKTPSPFAQPLVQLYRDFIDDSSSNASTVI
ncbi:hypothetical protein BGZ47_003397 [Haplosporangium gracile]|nr:hypothetical protein BGZ47_003397 [Haplosporangium gracile]